MLLGPRSCPGPGGTGPRGSRLAEISIIYLPFNLLSFFTSLFREGAAAASSCRLSVCLSVSGRVGLGPGALRTQPMGPWGAGRWVQCRQATVNFKEFLQDIFINFFSWLFLEMGVGEGSRWAGLGFVFGSCSWFFLYTHIYIFKERRRPLCLLCQSW